MDVSDLHRLGRWLISVARTAADADTEERRLVPGQEAVLEDVLRHPGTTVTDIRNRTGFTQSHVSASVRRLCGWELIAAEPDPVDRRRTRLTTTPNALATILERARRPVDALIAEAVGDPRAADRVVTLLGELMRLLPPQGGSVRERPTVPIEELSAKPGSGEETRPRRS